MARVVFIPNAFETHKRDIKTAQVGDRLSDYMPKDYNEKRIQIIYQGVPVKNVQAWIHSFQFHNDKEEIIVRIFPGGLEATLIAAGWSTFWAGVVSTTVNIIVGLAVGFGLNMLMSAVMGRPRAENRNTYDNTEESPTYGWDGIQNTTRNGSPIQLVYGVHKVAGQFLSTFTKAVSDGKNKLYMLIGLCAGEVSAINGHPIDTDGLTESTAGTGLEIDGNTANTFADIDVTCRMGAWDQAIIPGFNDIRTQQDQNTEVASTAYTYTTTDDVQAVELQFRFPAGLYRMNNHGALLPYEIEIRYRYREQGGSYGSYATVTFSAKTRSQYNAMHRIDFASSDTYEIEIERVTAQDTSQQVSNCYLVGVSEINLDDVAYNGIALLGVKAVASEQLNGRLPNVTSIIHGKKVAVFQPDDHFGEDTQQNMRSDGALLWGWNGANTLYATTAATHDYQDETFAITIEGESTSDWDDTTVTGPFWYKEITGDFDLRVRAVTTDGDSPGDACGIICRSQDDSTDWYGIFKENLSSTDSWRTANTNGGITTEGSGSTAHTYLRLVRSGSTFTSYTSDDGDTWTQREQVTRSDMSATVDLGLACYCSSSTATMTRFVFEDLEFADTTCYSTECNNNPAWVIYDLLTDAHYGLGSYIDSSQIDLSSFINFAGYCKTLVSNGQNGYQVRHRFDGVIDTAKSGWEHILNICENARAMVLMQGDKIHINWQAVKDPVQLFCVSNIKADSFSMTYSSPKVNANYWEHQFLNQDNDYEQDFAVYVDPEIESGEPYRKQTSSKYGITRPAEAYREALFACKANRHITTLVSFETGIDAIACEPGDIIEVQHSVPQWGSGGRVVSATATTVTLSEKATLLAGYTYEITIRHIDDSMETRTITTSPGDTWTVTVSTDFTTIPGADEIYAIGKQDILTKPFQVAKIDRTNDLECRIEAVEYNEDIFDDDIGTLPDITYTELPDPRKIPDDVTNLILTERAQIQDDGSIVNVIDVTYTFPENAVKADIFWREYGKTAWQYAGRSRSTHFVIANDVAYGITYEVAVVSIGPFNASKTADAVETETITIQGRAVRPDDVTGLVVTRVGDTVYLRWNANDDLDLKQYEIRYGASSWELASVLGTTVDNQFSTTNFAAGQAYFQVKAMNTSGIYSENAASVQETLEGRLNENIIVSSDEASGGWAGTKTNMSIDGSDLELDVATGLTGSYETAELDCGASVRSRVSCFLQMYQDDLLSTWAASTFTWGSETAENTTWGGNEDDSHITPVLYFRYGNTSGSLGDYEIFRVGEYTGRYFQFKIEFTSDSVNYSVVLEEMVIQVDVPDIFASGENVSVAASGTTTITFSNYTDDAFNVTPHFLAVPDAGSAGDTVEVVSVSATAATVRYYNSSGTQVAGNVNFIARGY